MDLIMWRAPSSIRLVENTSRAEFTIQTNQFYSNENTTKNFIARVEKGNNYLVDNNKKSTIVPIMRTSQTSDDRESRISVAEVAVTAILDSFQANSPVQSSRVVVPTIAIHSVTSEIQEGEVAEFQLHASVSLNSEIFVNLDLVPNEKVTTTQHQVVEFPANQRTTNFVINTIDDDDAGPDSELSVSIISGYGYELAPNNTATITISDSADRERVRLARVDSINQSILSEYVERTGTETLELINNRMEFLAAGRTGTNFKLGNNNYIAEFMKTGNELVFENQPFRSSTLGESSFSFELFQNMVLKVALAFGEKEVIKLYNKNWGKSVHFGVEICIQQMLVPTIKLVKIFLRNLRIPMLTLTLIPAVLKVI